MKYFILSIVGVLVLSGCAQETKEEMTARLVTEFKSVVKRRFHDQNLPGHDAMSSYQATYGLDPTDQEKRRIAREPKKGKPEKDRYDLYVYDEAKDFEIVDSSNPWKPIKAKVRYVRQHWTFDIISNWFKTDSIYDVEEEWSYYHGECRKEKTRRVAGRRPWDWEVERTSPPTYEKKIKELNYGIDRALPPPPDSSDESR